MSESQLRKASHQLIGENLEGEEAPFYISVRSAIDIQPAAHVFVPDLVAKVLDILEENERFFSLSLYYSKIYVSVLDWAA